MTDKPTEEVDPFKLAESITGSDAALVQPEPVPAPAPPTIEEEKLAEQITAAEPGVETIEGLQAPGESFMAEESKPAKGKRTSTADPFKNLIPSQDRLAVYRIDPKGHKAYVASYGSHDLARSEGIEMFISEYVVPEWGPGDYVVEVRDPSGKVKKQGLVPIPVPLNAQRETQKGPSLNEILAAQQKMQEDADKKAGNSMQNMMSMVSMMKEFMPKSKEGGGGGGDSSMLMMMMMMMQQMNQKPSGPDPMVQMLMQKLASMEEKQNLPPPIPLPLPPPPLPSSEQPSQQSTVEMLKVFGEMMKMNQPPQAQQNQTMETILTSLITKMLQPDKSSLTAKDIIDLMPTLKDMATPQKGGVSTFNEYMEGLLKLDELRGGPSEGPSLLAGLAEMVTGVIRDIKMEQMKIESMQRHGRSPAEIQRLQQRLQQQRQQQQQLGEGQYVERDPNAEPEVESDEQQRKGVPPIPVAFRKFPMRIMMAYKKKELPKMIMAYLEGLIFLRENSEAWAPYVEEMMMAAAKGDKARALRFNEVFLFSFAKKKLLNNEIVAVLMKTLTENWETIVKETKLDKALKTAEEDIDQEQVDAEVEATAGLEDEEAAGSEEDDEIDPVDIQQQEPAPQSDIEKSGKQSN